MKTRRSIQLEKSNLNYCMQSVLFPEKRTRNISGIVPETPGNHTSSIIKSTFSTTASVLETPDDNQKIVLESSKNKNTTSTNLSKDLQAKNTCSNNQLTKKCNGEKEPCVIDATPDFSLNKRKGITSILESEYNAPTNLDKEKNNGLNIPLSGDKSPIKKTKQSLAETILPFDLNNQKLISKKLSTFNKSTPKRKSLSTKLNGEEIHSLSPALKNSKTHFNTITSDTECNSTSAGNYHPKDISFDCSFTNKKSTVSNRKLRASRNVTKFSFENSNLDLTDTNDGNSILLSDEITPIQPVQDIPNLNFSSTDDETENSYSKYTSKNRTVQIQKVVQEHFEGFFETLSPLTCLDHEKQMLNKKKSLFKENSSPMSNYQRKIIEGELSSLNRSIFQSQESLTPTQPATILILQGVVALVDVRSGAENRSIAFKEVLLELGAEVTDKFSAEVTHVIFRDGSRSTYQRAIQRGVHLVSPLWVDACRVKSVRVSESLFPISADYGTKVSADVAIGKPSIPRKMKSMQPRDLEEDVLVAEQKMRRKQRLLSNDSNSETATPFQTNFSSHTQTATPALTKAASLTEEINSPLFGIAHLLTPKRGRENRESVSSISSEKSSTEKEFSTPLATRMYNRLLSPITDSPLFPCKKVCLAAEALSKRDNEENRNKKHSNVGTRRQSIRLARQRIASRSSSSDDADFRSSRVRAENPKLDSISRLIPLSSEETEKEHNIVKNSSSLSSQEANKSSTSYESAELVAPKSNQNRGNDDPESQPKIDENGLHAEKGKPRKSILKKKTTDHPRRSKRYSVNYKNIDTLDQRSHTPQEPDASSHVLEKCLEIDIRAGNKSNLSSSLPSCSQATSEAPKRRRLHTVDIVDPSQDLIIPSTPPFPDQVLKPAPYDDLRMPSCLSQREEMKLLNKKFKGELKVVPPPRTTKLKGKEIISPNYNGNLAISAESTSRRTPTTTIEERTPKRRFSLLPSERNSLEEFRSPSNRKRQKKSFKKISPVSYLPSLCVTSIHSRNIESIYFIIRRLGGFCITSQVSHGTTHIVCGSERRTLNVLLGISLGCWILDVSWLYESVELQKWAPEEPFELFNFCPGAKISRMIRLNKSESLKPNLFSNVGRIYVAELESPPQYIVQELLQNCGANICSTIRSADLIVGTSTLETSLMNVRVNWVFDCIQFWELKKLEYYLISSEPPTV